MLSRQFTTAPGRLAIWVHAAEQERAGSARLCRHLQALPVGIESIQDSQAGDDLSAALRAQLDRADLAVVFLSASLIHSRDWQELLLPRLAERTQHAKLQVILINARPCHLPSECQLWPYLTFGGKSLLTLSATQQDERCQQIARSIAFAFDLPLPDGAQSQAVADYRKRVLAPMGQISAGEVAGPHRWGPLPILPLAEMFVWPTLEERGSTHSRGSALQRWQQASAQPGSSLAWRRELRRRIELLENPEQSDLNGRQIDVALRMYGHIMLIGRPGSGKTCLLRFLAWRAVQDNVLPVYCSLSELVHSDDLQASLRSMLQKYSSEVAEAFGEWQEYGRVLLLLDGADEVADQHRRGLMARVQKLLRAHPCLQCVVTSRQIDSAYLDEDIAQYTVQDFSYWQIRDFIYRYKRCRAKWNNQPDPDAEAKRLLGELDRLPSLLNGPAQTPLLLLVICLLDERLGCLPPELGELYELAIETLLVTWPQGSPDGVRKSVRRLDPQALRRALTEVALRAQVAGASTLTREQVLSALAAGLSAAGCKRAADKATQYLDALGADAGLLQEVAPKVYSFLHLTFREYLVAVHFADAMARDWNDRMPLLAHRVDSRWREVMHFALKHLAGKDSALAGKLLLAIATEATDGWDAIHPTNLLLASTLLVDGKSLPVDTVRTVFGRLVRAASLPMTALTQIFIDTAERLQVAMDDAVATDLSVLLRFDHSRLWRSVFHVLAGSSSTSAVALQLCEQALASKSDEVAFLAAVGVARAAAMSQEISAAVLHAMAAGCATAAAGLPWAREFLAACPEPLQQRLHQGLAKPEEGHSAAILLALQRAELPPALHQDVVAKTLEALTDRQASCGAAKLALRRLLLNCADSVPAILATWSVSFATPSDSRSRSVFRRGSEPSQAETQEARRRAIEEVLLGAAPHSRLLIDGLARYLLCSPALPGESISESSARILEGAAAQHRNSWEPPPQPQARQWVREALLVHLDATDVDGKCCLRAHQMLIRLQVPRPELLLALAACLRRTTDIETRWLAMQQLFALHKDKAPPDATALAPILAALQDAASDPSPSVRVHALYWLHRLHRLPREELAVRLQPLFEQEDDVVALHDAVTLAKTVELDQPPKELLLPAWYAEAILEYTEPASADVERPAQQRHRLLLRSHIEVKHHSEYAERLAALDAVALGVARQFWDRLCQRLLLGVRQGAVLSGVLDDAAVQLGLRVCIEHPESLSWLANALSSADRVHREVALALLTSLMPGPVGTAWDGPLAARRIELVCRLAALLSSDDTQVCWAVHDKLRKSGHGRAERRTMLRRFLSANYPLTIRVRAAIEIECNGPTRYLPTDAAFTAVLEQALASGESGLILDVARLLCPCPEPYEAALRAGLQSALSRQIAAAESLEAAGYLGLLAAEDQGQAADVLLRVMDCEDLWPGRSILHSPIWGLINCYHDAYLARRDEPNDRLISRTRLFNKCYLAGAAAMILFLMEQQQDELRRVLVTWAERGIAELLAEAAPTSRRAAPAPPASSEAPASKWRFRCELAAELLPHLGEADNVLARLQAAHLLQRRLFDGVSIPLIHGEPEQFWAAIVTHLLSDMHSLGHGPLWTQVQERARADAAVREVMIRLLLLSLRTTPRSDLAHWVAAECLLGLDYLDEEVTTALVWVDAKWRYYLTLNNRMSELAQHPLILRELLASLGSSDIEHCDWVCGRIAPVGPGGGVAEALERLLARPEHALSYEAASRLCEMDRYSAIVRTALLRCLEAPMQPGPIYSGASIRHQAAKLLCNHEPALTDELTLSATLLPILTNGTISVYDVLPATKLLCQYPGLRPIVAQALCARLRAHTSGWPALGAKPLYPFDNTAPSLLNALHYTGCERDAALALALSSLADENSHHETVFHLLSEWKQERPLDPEPSQWEARSEKRERHRYLLLQSLPGRAQLLAETRVLPAAIPQVLGSFLGYSSNAVLSLCTPAAGGTPATAPEIALAAQLMRGQAADTPAQMLARLYFFYRLASWAGLHVGRRAVWHSEEPDLFLDEDLSDVPEEAQADD